MNFRIRAALPGDEKAIFALICALAEYEDLTHEVVGSAEALAGHLFDRPVACSALVVELEGAELEAADPNDSCGKRTVGFALYFPTYSTFLTAPGIYLEDLFVLSEFRGHGLGKALLVKLAQIAVESDAGRLEWAVLNWNKPSIDFYLSLGSVPMNDWTTHRITGDALRRLAETAKRE